MASEIADSDAESDIIVQGEAAEEELLSPPATRPNATENDPTQRLSDLNSSPNGGTGSTDRLIHGLRRPTYDGAGDEHSELVNLPSMPNAGDRRWRAQSAGLATGASLSEQAQRKRPKTYGSNARDADLDLFGTGPLEMERQTPEPCQVGQDAAGEELPPLSPNDLPSPGPGQRERDRPRRVVSLLQRTMINPTHHVTTATSSMGGYQSINLDFRGGIDMHTNPFGSISQVSVDNPGSTEAAPLPPKSHDDQLNDMIEQFAGPDVQSQMVASPIRECTPLPPSVEPLNEAEHDSNIPHTADDLLEGSTYERPSKRRKTDTATLDPTVFPTPKPRAASVSVESNPNRSDATQVKKRGRPKSKKKADDVDGLAAEEPSHASLGPPPVEEHQPAVHSQANTTELSSQSSQSSQPASNTKRKRKKTKPEDRHVEEPKKLPSSELNLSDEHTIGLPQENYKPRPSRSRSKRLNAAADTSIPFKDGGDSAMFPAPDTPASKPSTGKSKKSKVKRAKTSAAALLKASAPMLSDGEDDVVWMDSKPAPVKLTLPPNLSVVKKEDPAGKQEESEDELQQPELPGRNGSGTAVRVEIPLVRDEGKAQSDGASDKKGKKKRGRPKKGTTEQETLSANGKSGSQAAEAESNGPTKVEERLALASKDPNTSITKPSSKAKSKPTVTDSDDEDKADAAQVQANPPPTPSKPSTPVDKEKSPSAPTNHTPSKPSSATRNEKPTHSPLKPTPLSANSALTHHRVGLSRRSKIPSLLRKVDRAKPPPTKTSVKVTELKIKGVNAGDIDAGDGDGDGDGEGKPWTGVLRDKDGRLVEWDF